MACELTHFYRDLEEIDVMLIQSDFHRWLPVRAARRETQMRQPGRLHRRGLFTSVGAPTVAHASTKRLGVSVRTLINLSPRRSARPAPPRRATISEIPDRISRDRSIPACRARAPGAILIYAGPMLSVGRSSGTGSRRNGSVRPGGSPARLIRRLFRGGGGARWRSGRLRHG